MVFIVLFTLSLVGTGFLFGQNPHAPDAPPLLEGNHPELDSEAAQAGSSFKPDPTLPFYYQGFHLTPRLGYENTQYNQGGAPFFTQSALRANLDLTWLPPKSKIPFEGEFRLNFTALPLVASRAKMNAQFFNANLDLGFPLVQTSFLKLRVLGGIYYSSTSVKDNSFGYPAFVAPEIYPDLTLYLFDGLTLNTTYRYVYLGGLLDASQVQISRSVALSVFIDHSRSISALFEDNGFNLIFPASSTLVQYYSFSFTLGLSL